ncbi:MAG: SDR family oxidoreductase [candidate division Zixibacteria bacterium]|nr:SDR family oxidoreductase [candidate division Zixibacteria bacterium]
MSSLKDKVIVVTGAASGIGQAAAFCCAAGGGKIVAADIDEAGLGRTAARIGADGGNATTVRVDIANEAQVRRVMETAMETHGRIDALINCAGVLEGPFVSLDEFEETTWDRVIDINLKGSFFAAKHAATFMKRQGGGVIILIASGAGVHGGSSSVAYGSSKGGVHGLSLVLAGQLAASGIRVHAVCPGGISTPLKLSVIAAEARLSGKTESQALQEASQYLGDPEGVGRILAFLASPDADYVRGTVSTR